MNHPHAGGERVARTAKRTGVSVDEQRASSGA